MQPWLGFSMTMTSFLGGALLWPPPFICPCCGGLSPRLALGPPPAPATGGGTLFSWCLRCEHSREHWDPGGLAPDEAGSFPLPEQPLAAEVQPSGRSWLHAGSGCPHPRWPAGGPWLSRSGHLHCRFLPLWSWEAEIFPLTICFAGLAPPGL